MSTAPRTGECVVVVYHEYNDKTKRLRIGCAQWLCNEQGEDWGWRRPMHPGTTQYAIGWLKVEELLALQQKATKVPPAPKTIASEYDL